MRWVVACGGLLTMGVAAVLHSPHGEKQMATDVTIHLHDPIISTGGTVFIIPREVDASSIRDADSKLSVDVGESLSIVRFDYARGER